MKEIAQPGVMIDDPRGPYVHPHLMRTLDVRNVVFNGGAGPLLHATMRDGSRRAFLDFFTDVGTSSLGYNSPEHRAVLELMLSECIPAHAPNLYRYEERDRAAEGLCDLTGFDKVFFCNSGTEAVEAAIKLARKRHWDKGTKRIEIWSCEDAFHGRTLGALSAGDGPAYHNDGFGPFPDGFHHFRSLEHLEEHIWEAAAVIIAPVFGNNDVRIYPEGWLENLRQMCSEHDVLLIFDEVQTGSGRTGAPTYAQKRDVKPDIITLAKGMAMGAPVGAMLAREEYAAAFTPSTHFSTFGGNPLSCAFVNGMIQWLENEGNLKGVEAMGKHIKGCLGEMLWPQNIRGEGMLIAFDIDVDGIAFAQRCLGNGLLIGAFRPGPGPVKITPPLNIEMGAVDQGMVIMNRVYEEMKA